MVMGDEFGRSAGAGAGSGGSFFVFIVLLSIVLLIVIITFVVDKINSNKARMKTPEGREAYKRNEELADKFFKYLLWAGFAGLAFIIITY